MPESKRILIIGAGPTGLGAASRLHKLDYQNWTLYERHGYAGGHASSVVDPQGFTWDEGGHVIFSHYPYFDLLIDEALKSEFHERVRESWIFTRNSWIPYPFQNNLRYLPKSAQIDCLEGAAKVAGRSNGREAQTFRSWILATFGDGIANHFMFQV
jgi:protoporphyrinogen oxidase